MGHETKIIIKNANHNKLWNLISNKSGVEEWNYRKKRNFFKKKNKFKKNIIAGTKWMKWNDRNLIEKFRMNWDLEQDKTCFSLFCFLHGMRYTGH